MHNAMPSRGADVQPYKYNGKELDVCMVLTPMTMVLVNGMVVTPIKF